MVDILGQRAIIIALLLDSIIDLNAAYPSSRSLLLYITASNSR